MSRLINLAGKKFARWLVIKRVDSEGNKSPHWLARCDCGIERKVRGNHLRSKASRSCGCFNREKASRLNFIHGMKGTETYACWKGMRGRCNTKSNSGFKNYGARGVRVCSRWKDFCLFLNDMGVRPPGLTIERIDNEQGYSPENCRWASRLEQNQNTRTVRLLTHNGQTMSMSAWGRELMISRRTISNRISWGWSVERALTMPARSIRGREMKC